MASDFSFSSSTGTTVPIFVSNKTDPAIVQPGATYFLIKIHAAQVVYKGNIWQKAKQVAITSQVNLNSPILGNHPITAIQQYRSIKSGQREQLGLAANLVSLVPATMERVTLSIDFLVDTSNRLFALSNLINDKTFISDISFVPGVAAVAQQVGSISQKIIQTFMDPQEQIPILKFYGDFNLSDGTFKEGYYIILGNRDPNFALPNDAKELRVTEAGQVLYSDNSPVESLSYIVLKVSVVSARTRALGSQSAWDKALTKAETRADDIAQNPFASDDDKKAAWNDCIKALAESRALLDDDASYLPVERKQIYQTSYTYCRQILQPDSGTKSSFSPTVKGGLESLNNSLEFYQETTYPDWLDTLDNRQLLDIPMESDLDQMAADYQTQVVDAQRILELNA